uniref:MAD2 mitotic arrest deficient-like 1 (yeast) n=1 Tax=Eptatretus burgeri TaxID=7764 RepID=A0A8C4QJM2_EPTBU
MAATAVRAGISLSGSAKVISEFFYYGVNNVLYQRGVYPPETFAHESRFGMSLLGSTDTAVQKYLSNITSQIQEWLEAGLVRRLVLILVDSSNGEVLERWQFDVTCTTGSSQGRDECVVKKEMQAVIRQITAAVTMLPLLESPCSFDLLVYTDASTAMPPSWENSGPQSIAGGGEVVRLRSFSTGHHTVATSISYRTS